MKMKKYSHILCLLVSLTLVSCSGSRTAGTLEIQDEMKAETQFMAKYIASGETYRFSPTKNWRDSFDPQVNDLQVTVTISNKSSVAVKYPDPDWVRTEDVYAEPWIILPPGNSDVLHKGHLGDFRVRLITELDGTHANVKMSVIFDEAVNSIERFYLTATWSDGP